MTRIVVKSSVTPLVTEFLVEAQSGGTCVVRVVSSAFGTGANWEQDFLDDAKKHWFPFFDNLRLYLTDFAGQQVTKLETSADVAGSAGSVLVAVREALGAGEVGKPVDTRGVTGHVERIGELGIVVRISEPVPGYLHFGTFDTGDGLAMAVLQGYLFSDDAAGYVEREQAGWKAWLEGFRGAQ